VPTAKLTAQSSFAPVRSDQGSRSVLRGCEKVPPKTESVPPSRPSRGPQGAESSIGVMGSLRTWSSSNIEFGKLSWCITSHVVPGVMVSVDMWRSSIIGFGKLSWYGTARMLRE
jgi:hypothetical protein